MEKKEYKIPLTAIVVLKDELLDNPMISIYQGLQPQKKAIVKSLHSTKTFLLIGKKKKNRFIETLKKNH